MTIKSSYIASLCAIISLSLFLLSCKKENSSAAPLRIIGTPNLVGYDVDRAMLDIFEKESGIKIEYIRGPESVSERLNYYFSLLEKKSPDIDVYFIDVIWPAIFSEYMVDLSDPFKNEKDIHFKTIIENNTVNGKLVGIPFFTDAGLLYYRTDLLQKYGFAAPPRTWDELEKYASVIQEGERRSGKSNFWGYVWQGAAYEGLTCNALEWQVSHNGGNIIEKDGSVSVDNPNAVYAFTRASKWIGTISPPSILGFQEEDSRSIWHHGDALFMRNWPYAYALGQTKDSLIKGKFKVTILPSGDTKHAATLGGWQLSISKYSSRREDAIKAVKFLTSRKIQKKRAIMGSYLPTIPDLYDDRDILKANPFFRELKDIFLGGAVARPSTVTGKKYDRISKAYYTYIHQILKKSFSSAVATKALAEELEKINSEK